MFGGSGYGIAVISCCSLFSSEAPTDHQPSCSMPFWAPAGRGSRACASLLQETLGLPAGVQQVLSCVQQVLLWVKQPRLRMLTEPVMGRFSQSRSVMLNLVDVCQGCCYQVSQTEWLKNQRFLVMVLQAQSPRSRCWHGFLLRLCRRGSVPFLSFLEGCWLLCVPWLAGPSPWSLPAYLFMSVSPLSLGTRAHSPNLVLIW